MEELPEIHVDWNDAYGVDCIGLDCNGAQMDIREQGIILKEGLRVRLYGDAYESRGTIRLFELNGHTFFVAQIDKGTFREISPNSRTP